MALSNSKYNAIMRRYQQRQFQNKHEQDGRVAEVRRRIPVMAELEQEILGQSAAMARERLLGGDGKLSAMKEKLLDLREQKAMLLRASGFAPDYMEMRYQCLDCRDTGYVGDKKCRCFLQARIEMLYAQSNIREILERENFDTFSYRYFDNSALLPGLGKTYAGYMKQVAARCRQFTREFPEKGGNILFTGDTGVGKTFLTNCIARELIEQYCSVIYLSAHDLFDIFSQHEFRYDTDERMEEVYQDILECEMLIIDDLGTEVNNTFVTSRLFYCINERLGCKRGTIISTNLNMDMLRDIYSERVTSRLMSGYLMIPLYGGDIRVKMRRESAG